MNTTKEPIIPVKGEDRTSVDERLRQAILDKRQAEVDAWSEQIKKIRDGLSGLTEDARQESQKRLDELIQARDQSVEQLTQLRDATKDNFEHLLKQTDTVFQKLADQFHALVESNT